MKPTWAGWPEVIEAQNADVESKAVCLWILPWDETDDIDWVPDMTGTEIHWDDCSPLISLATSFEMTARVTSTHGDLWTPVDKERTVWYPVIYPN